MRRELKMMSSRLFSQLERVSCEATGVEQSGSHFMHENAQSLSSEHGVPSIPLTQCFPLSDVSHPHIHNTDTDWYAA